MNRKLKNIVFESSCSIYIGDRGSGKSCLMALTCEVFQKKGYKVFCNYPYKNSFQIPYKTIPSKYGDKVVLDKEFLYRSDLSHSLIMIDEARTVWNARAYQSWNEQDEEFFNFIRKCDTYVVLATQRYDGLDLNIRCAADYTFFIQRSRFFRNLSTVDVSRSCQLKVADKNFTVVSRGFSKNANKVLWDIGEIPIMYTLFYRKPFYNNFDTNFINSIKEDPDLTNWNSLLDPESASEVSLGL